MIDKVFLIGRLTKDIEMKTTSTGKEVVSYSLAVKIGKDNTEFIDCTTFGEGAKLLNTYCSKGDMIGIEGQIRTNTYVDKNDVKHKSVYVLSDKIMLLNTKKEINKEKSIEKDEIIVDESDLPF